MKRLMWAEALVGLAATLFFELFPQPLCRLFGAANESVYYTEFALRCIRWLLCALPFACVNKGAFIFLQSIGKPVASMLLSLLREIVGGVGLVLLLPCFFGLNGILYFMPAAAAGPIKRQPHKFSVAFRQKLLYNAVKSFGNFRRHAEQGAIV